VPAITIGALNPMHWAIGTKILAGAGVGVGALYLATKKKTSTTPAISATGLPATDANGNPIYYDANGNPITLPPSSLQDPNAGGYYSNSPGQGSPSPGNSNGAPAPGTSGADTTPQWATDIENQLTSMSAANAAQTPAGMPAWATSLETQLSGLGTQIGAEQQQQPAWLTAAPDWLSKPPSWWDLGNAGNPGSNGGAGQGDTPAAFVPTPPAANPPPDFTPAPIPAYVNNSPPAPPAYNPPAYNPPTWNPPQFPVVDPTSPLYNGGRLGPPPAKPQGLNNIFNSLWGLAPSHPQGQPPTPSPSMGSWWNAANNPSIIPGATAPTTFNNPAQQVHLATYQGTAPNPAVVAQHRKSMFGFGP
jgi:hypothetical protein